MFRTVIVTILLLMAAPAYAKLYKCTDASGNISYTDEPCIGGEELKLPPLPTYKSKKPATSSSADRKSAPGTKDSSKGYTRLEITQPADDKQIQSEDGKVDISIAVEPGLNTNDGHKIQIKFDGQSLKTTGATTRVQLNDVERGTHTVQASIIDAKGAVVMSSETIKFHLLKRSLFQNSGAPRAPTAPTAPPAKRAPTLPRNTP